MPVEIYTKFLIFFSKAFKSNFVSLGFFGSIARTRGSIEWLCKKIKAMWHAHGSTVGHDPYRESELLDMDQPSGMIQIVRQSSVLSDWTWINRRSRSSSSTRAQCSRVGCGLTTECRSFTNASQPPLNLCWVTDQPSGSITQRRNPIFDFL